MSTLTKKYIKTFCKFLPHKEDINDTDTYVYNISTCIVNGSYYFQLDSNRLPKFNHLFMILSYSIFKTYRYF